MPTEAIEVAPQRQGVITDLAGIIVADWRYIKGKMLIDPRVTPGFANDKFLQVLNKLKAEGTSEIVPVPVPGGGRYGIRIERTPLVDSSVGVLDVNLKQLGYFLHSTPRPVD